ncbi:hypothetical protein IFM89_014247 [Coptis chinensis]|uniref:ubiquitinyl hydrolase 1 n=1 Tax=Coptis chinensis TaxID=261450 RepID=A0A835MEE6_9MAGN|nr:hypothetical protein IFM89_014247 [Coptis chinensis]
MLVLRDIIGFKNLIVIISFTFGLIVSLIIRWKWNKSVERKKEILRLVALAEEESARVEFQAQFEYDYRPSYVSIPVVRQHHSQCVVCYCPTTARCARCKAVNYCSGKCQIIHWRLGHKDECNPPNNSFQFNGPESDTDQKTMFQEHQDEICGTNDSVNSKTIDTVLDDPQSSDPAPAWKADVEVGQASVISDNVSTSTYLAHSATTAYDPLTDVSVRDLPVPSTPKRLEEPLFNCSSQAGSDTKPFVNDTKLTKSPPSEDRSSDGSVDSISHLGKSKKITPRNSFEVPNSESPTSSGSTINVSDDSKVSKISVPYSDFWKGTLDTNGFGNDYYDDSTESSVSEGGEENLADNKSSSQFPLNLSQQDVLGSQSQHFKPQNRSDDVDPIISQNRSSSCGVPLSGKIATDVSMVKSSPTSEKPSFVETKGARSTADTLHTAPTGSPEIRNSLEKSGSNGLKTSVRKVVQQFKVYKISKHDATGFGSESAEKYNYKMLFPYDLFVKLYHWNKVELRPCGLTNCGNSCYANAVLQCLAFTRPLTAYLLKGPKKEWCFMCEFEGLVTMGKESKSPLSPIGILSQLPSIGSHLGHGREEDAHEFLRYAIDKMQSVCLKEGGEHAVGPLAEETTLIGLIFGGYLQSKIRCMKCHGKSERQERIMDLTVEIHGDIGTLEQALEQFTATEILDGDNKYECLRCRSYEKAKKRLTIVEAPNVLTIALKRFQGGKFGKLNKAVLFPEILNLAPYMSGTSDKSPIYRLYAVVVHLDTMNAAFSGHYVCYIRNFQGKWFKIDDSIVKPVELEKVLSKGAYMLLYARCSPRAPSLIRNKIMSSSGISKGRSRLPETLRPNYTVSSATPYTLPRRAEDYPDWTTLDGPTSFESFDSFDRRFHPMHRIPEVDLSSDSSSLLSCSDEGSCSTESTRDSASTDDLSDHHLFGEAGRNWNSPSRVLEDSDGSSPFSRFSQFAVSERHASGFSETSGCTPPEADREFETNGVYSVQSQNNGRRIQGWQNNGSLPILHSDTSKHSRNLTNSISNSSHNNSSFRETDMERLGWGNPFDVNSGVSQRRSTRERIVQTFY